MLLKEYNKEYFRGRFLLYHTTHNTNILDILYKGYLKPNPFRGSHFELQNKRYTTISLSRDKSYIHDNFNKNSHTLIFDGEAIRRNFRLEPYNDFKYINKSNPTHDKYRKEFEEVIITDVNFPIEKYLLGIRSNSFSLQAYNYGILNEDEKKLMAQVSTYCYEHKIPYFNPKGDNMMEFKEKTPNTLNESIDLNALKLQPSLNPKFWNIHGVLDNKVKKAIKVVADDFYKSLNINVPVLDIIFTGSLANYNWSKYSDVDIHIVIDFDELYKTLDPSNEYNKEEFLDDYFTDKKELWNKNHKMTIFGHPVEAYVQNSNVKLDATGIFSITKNEWESTPTHINYKPNFKLIRTKSVQIMKFIDKLEQNEDVKGLDEIKDKIKKFRQRGLDTDGELSNSNLIYKVLRREGYIEKLYELKNKIFDKQNSVKESFSL